MKKFIQFNLFQTFLNVILLFISVKFVIPFFDDIFQISTMDNFLFVLKAKGNLLTEILPTLLSVSVVILITFLLAKAISRLVTTLVAGFFFPDFTNFKINL